MKYLIPSLGFLMMIIVSSCNNTENAPGSGTAAAGDSSITVPDGFTAVVFADSLGKARHIAVNGNGDVFVKLDGLHNGHGIIRLKDTNNDGVSDQQTGFGNYKGTGIYIRNEYLYASSNSEIFRYKLGADGTPDTAGVMKIVTGLIDKGEHNSKSIALDKAGNIYVNIGAYSNACQVDNRQTGSPGINPCPILDSAGGIWQFKADKANQQYGDGTRFATGIRNIVGLDWNNEVNNLYAIQHGRDQLDQLYPDRFTEDQRVELPAEELFKIRQGGDYGWPYCYYDPMQKQKVQSPEYGGDGKKTTGCEGKEKPIYGFPAHWAPNGLLFYTGSQFPEKYKNGAFIAFHGSWNRAPQPQAGYSVVFLPFKDGMPSGDYEIFADGFAGTNKTPGGAKFRPCGLAEGPDGSLYITDDQQGRVWKVIYRK